MWLLKLVFGSSLVSIFPLALTFFMITTDWGARILKLVLGLTILFLFAFVLLAAFGHLDIAFKMAVYVSGFWIWWSLGTITGIFVWGLIFLFFETILFVIRTIIPEFKFSLLGFIFNKL